MQWEGIQHNNLTHEYKDYTFRVRVDDTLMHCVVGFYYYTPLATAR